MQFVNITNVDSSTTTEDIYTRAVRTVHESTTDTVILTISVCK
jgi:hypothetical protein